MSTEAPNVLTAQQGVRSSLRADFSWMFVVNAVYAGGQFATLILLAKLLQDSTLWASPWCIQ